MIPLDKLTVKSQEALQEAVRLASERGHAQVDPEHLFVSQLFSPTDYLDANPHDENHLLLRKEDYEGNSCYVVESTPRQADMSIGRRMSWIDATRFIPLKIEYSDKTGTPPGLCARHGSSVLACGFGRRR